MNPNRKVALHTLGCKLNFSETSTIARQFGEAGYARVSIDEGADVVVINTCSVTDQADKKCRNIVRKAKGLNPDAYVAVIGCYAQLKPQEIADITGVNMVLGANEKFNLLDHIDLSKKEETKVLTERIKETKDFIPSFSSGDRTRTFLKVQDGCNYFCSFCTIPLARGRSRSASIEDTIAQANEVAKTNAKEVVLTGVNIGDFGTPQGETFLDLVKKLDQVDGIERFRISSIEPNLLSDEIISFCAQSKKFVPHFHIPLQSGSDKVLKSMRRRYLTDLYTDRIDQIHALFEDPCIGVDVIVGFPGETEDDFQTTYDFLLNLNIAYLHVFTYSERANTTALRIDEVVPMQIRNERSKKLRILSLKKKRAFYESQMCKTKEVLFESENHDGTMYGFTTNYVKVAAPYQEHLVNQIHPLHLEKIDPDGNARGVLTDLIDA
ncbi:MAG: tRNA (N(6)-L-threonylcarbamoyladenosine(37)-C(2))-methylthiotransferase MtaB [Flavobacteriales bacterium]